MGAKKVLSPNHVANWPEREFTAGVRNVIPGVVEEAFGRILGAEPPRSCSCSECSDLCDKGGIPGLPTPAEALAIVNAGRASDLSLYRVAIDLPFNPPGVPGRGIQTVFVDSLSPAFEWSDAGIEFDVGFRGRHGSECVFFDKVNRKCSIHDIKPLECRMAACAADVKTGSTFDLRADIVKLWLSDEGAAAREAWRSAIRREYDIEGHKWRRGRAA